MSAVARREWVFQVQQMPGAAANSDPAVRLDATFALPPAPSGAIGLVTQSGGIGIALREQLGQLGLGLSAMVSHR